MLLPAGGGVKAAAEKAAAPRSGTVTATYNIYAGGLKALTAEYTINRPDGTDGDYGLHLASRTTGLVRFLTPWRGTLTAEGAYRHGDPAPRRHESIAIWPDNTHIKRLTYAKDGTMDDLVVSNNGADERPENAAELMDGTIDVMTAALRVMDRVARDGNCEDSIEGFDGKRRFALTTRKTGTQEMKPTRYNIFGGSAVICTVEMTPKGGDWHEKLKGWTALQEESQRRGSLPTVWLARVEEDGPVLPVRVQIKSRYGSFLAHLTGYQ